MVKTTQIASLNNNHLQSNNAVFTGGQGLNITIFSGNMIINSNSTKTNQIRNIPQIRKQIIKEKSPQKPKMSPSNLKKLLGKEFSPAKNMDFEKEK